MSFTGVDTQDLQIVADRMAGTYGGIEDHIASLGLEINSVNDLLTDLEDGRFISTCHGCDVWEKPVNLDCGLCFACSDDIFGFEDEAFDDLEEITDECISDRIFNETDDEEDL